MKESHNYDHSHCHKHLKDTDNIKTTFYLNLMFAILELVVGLFSNSIALISNSIHDFGDSIILLTTLEIEKFSLKPKDKRFTYGYRRFTLVGALLNTTILLIGSTLIIYGAIKRLINPTEISVGLLFVFSLIGVFINLVGVYKVSKNKNVIGDILKLNLLYDVLSWVVIFIGSIIMYLTNYYIIDSILSLIIAAMILFSVIKGFKGLFSKLMQAVPEDINIEHIMEKILESEDILDCHDLHIWDLDGDDYIATFHIVVKDNLNETELMAIKERIKRKLENCKINHATIEIDTKTQAIYNKEIDIF